MTFIKMPNLQSLSFTLTKVITRWFMYFTIFLKSFFSLKHATHCTRVFSLKSTVQSTKPTLWRYTFMWHAVRAQTSACQDFHWTITLESFKYVNQYWTKKKILTGAIAILRSDHFASFSLYFLFKWYRCLLSCTDHQAWTKHVLENVTNPTADLPTFLCLLCLFNVSSY